MRLAESDHEGKPATEFSEGEPFSSEDLSCLWQLSRCSGLKHKNAICNDLFQIKANAPEFAWNATKALFNMGRRAEVEEEARLMVKKYPGNDFACDVEHHLLNHPPHPKSGRANRGGQIAQFDAVFEIARWRPTRLLNSGSVGVLTLGR